ncbi:MAG: OmpA family protein [Cytophagaceae bacterium]|nr:OmpA family protein [Cytophagaceae bacterium]
MTFSVCISYGQDKEFKKLNSDAQDYFDAEAIDEALKLYLQADKIKPKDPHVTYMIGICYHLQGHGLLALPFLETSKKAGNESLGVKYYLGLSYHLAHRFDESIALLQEFVSKADPEQEEMLETAKRTIQYCKHGKELVKNPVKVKIKNLGPSINSKYRDYVPGISADETVLIFTSRRDNTTGGGVDPQDGLYYEDVYISTKADTTWSPAIKMPIGINTEGHDGCVGISPDGQEMYIYRDIKKEKNGGDLYLSDLKGDVWSLPVNMGSSINSKYKEPSGSITADEKVFFFSSDREGGLGGMDIYMVKKQVDGKWGKPILLGPEINTSGHEDGPFIHADGKTLYFSSTSHNSMGGYDIFSCIINTETGQLVEKPKNIGYPINTADDDIFFVWSADNKRAYFSSYREGGYGDNDLYVLERDEANSALVVLKGTIKSCDEDKAIAATIKVTDNATSKIVGVFNSNSATGKYTVILPAGKNYGIAIEAPSYLFYSKNIDVPLLNHYLEIKDSVCLERIKIGTHIVLRNIFFDVNKATLRPESEAELERLADILIKNPTIKIQIAGHTDSDGNDDYNMKLSDARAHAVVTYLIDKKGIGKERLTWKGYGETKPVAPNDTPENKQLNRRTEFEIVSK